MFRIFHPNHDIESGPWGRKSRHHMHWEMHRTGRDFDLPDDAMDEPMDGEPLMMNPEFWGRRGGGRGPGSRDGFGRPPHGRGGRFFDNGMLKLVILALIAESPRHGYEVIKEISDRTGGVYAPSAGAVYPTLTLLEETGDIEVVKSEGNKKLYDATEAGRKTVEENRQAIDQVLARFQRVGENRDPRLIRAKENLRLALELKFRGRRLSDDTIAEIARLLNEAAEKIEAI